MSIERLSTRKYPPTKSVIVSILVIIATLIRTDRTLVGMKAAVEAGKVPFKGPLGYKNVVSTGSQANLVPDEKTAPFIQQAFELYGNTLQSAQEVLRKLTALGFVTDKGRPVSAQTFMRILRNPLYMGVILLPKWGMSYKGSFEPIVSAELFARVQAKLAGKSVTAVTHTRANPTFPLRVFVRCDYCSTPLTGSLAKGKYGYYFCRNKKCKKLSIPKEQIESKFVALLLRSQLEPECQKLLESVITDVWRMRSEHARHSVAVVTKKATELADRKNLLVDALLYRRITKDLFDEQMDRLNQDIALAEMAQQDAKIDELEIDTVLSFAKLVMGNVARLWMDSAIEAKHCLQRSLLPDGLSYSKEHGFGTPSSSSFFTLVEEFQQVESSLVSPMGFEPMLSP